MADFGLPSQPGLVIPMKQRELQPTISGVASFSRGISKYSTVWLFRVDSVSYSKKALD